jgi:hypothetical protein
MGPGANTKYQTQVISRAQIIGPRKVDQAGLLYAYTLQVFEASSRNDNPNVRLVFFKWFSSIKIQNLIYGSYVIILTRAES